MAYGSSNMPSSYHESAPSHGFRNCCCCLSLSLTLLTLIAIGTAFFFILVLKPQKPAFLLQSAAINNFNVEREPQRSSNSAVYLSLDIALLFYASNSNKVAINYSPTEFVCVYKGVILGVAKVPSFHQPAHSHGALTATLVVDHVNVVQASSLDLLNDATLNDKVALTISGPVKASINVLGINSPKVEVDVHCRLLVHPQERQIASNDCNVGRVTLSD